MELAQKIKYDILRAWVSVIFAHKILRKWDWSVQSICGFGQQLGVCRAIKFIIKNSDFLRWFK